MAALAVCGLLTFGAGTASAAEPPDIAQLVAAMQQEGQNAAEKAAFTGGGYRASLARAAETAAQAAAAAPVSAPAQEDPGETGGDEEPSEPAPVTPHSIHDENGYYVHNGSAYNSITKDGLWVGGTDENTGFHVDSGGNVTTTGSITVNRTGGAGSVTIDASTGKITGVTAGDISADSTDAVNGSQLYNAIKGATYAAGDGVVIADGSTTGEDKTISVKAGNGIEVGADGVAVKVNGNNLTVNENGLSLSETLSGLTSVTASGAITAGSFAAGNVKINENSGGTITGLTNTTWGGEYTPVTGQAATEDQLAIVSGKVDAAKKEASKHTTVKAAADGHIKVEEGTNTAGGKEYTLSAEGLLDTDLTNITESGKTAITNIAKGADQHIEAKEYAVDKDGKVTLTYVDGNGQAIDGQTATITGIASAEAVTAAKTEVVGDSNVKVDSSEEADGHTKYTVGLADTVTLGESTGSHVTIDGTAGTITATGAVTGSSFNAGSVVVDGTTNTITGLSNKEWNGTPVSGQAATEDQLKAVADADKYVTGGSINSTDGTLTLNQAKTGTVTISGLSDYVASVNDYVTGGSIDTSSGNITLNRKLSGSVTISGLKDYVSGIDTYVTGAKIDGTKLTINKNHGDAVEVDLSGLADGLSTSDYHLVANPTGGNYKVKDGKVELTIQNGNDTADKQTVTIEGIASTDDVTNIKTNVEELNKLAVKYTDESKTAVNLGSATLTTTGAITGGSFEVNGKTYISDAGLNANSQKITNVADGTIGTDSKDAVNGSQLQQVYDAMKEIDGTTYADGDGISISGEDNKISVNAGKGLTIVDDKVQVNLKDDEKNLELLNTGELALKSELNVTSVTAGGAVTAGSFSTTGSITGGSVKVGDVTINGGKITGLDTDSIQNAEDAVNKEYVDKLAFNSGKTYTAGNGIAISEAGEISAKAKENGNIVVDGDGISLAKEVTGLTSVTATGAIAAGSFSGTSASIGGIGISSGTITGLTNTEWTGTATSGQAATEDQLAAVQNKIKDYTAGDGISIDDDSDEISVAYGDGLTTDRQGNLLVNAGEGLGFNKDDNSLEVVTGDGLTISRNGEVTAAVGNGLDFDSDGKIVVEAASGGNLTVDSNGISLNKELTGLTGISTETLTASSGITVGGTQYISTSGLNAGNHVITNVADGQNKNDAVNYGQLSALQEDFTELNDLAVTYDAANKATITLDGTGGTKITNVAAGDISKVDSTDAVNGGQLYATNQIVGDGEWNTVSNYLTGDVKDLTDAANALDSAIGNNRYTGDNVLNANTDGKTYASVTAAIGTLDSNIGNLKFSGKNVLAEGKAASVTAALTTLDEKIGPMSWESTTFLRNQGNLSGAAQLLDNNLSQTLQLIGVKTTEDAEGNVIPNPNIDWTGFHYATGEAGSSSTTIVGVMRSLDSQLFNLTGRVDALDGGGTQSLSAFSKMSAANVNALSALSNMDTETAETLASLSTEDVQAMAAKAPAAAPAAPAPGDPTATSTRPGPDGESETGDTGDVYEVNQDLHVTGNTQLDKDLTVNGAGTFNNGLTVNTKTEGGTALTVNGGASINGTLNMNDNKITGVADGEISETSTDAVNGSQLWGVQQDIENNASAIASLGGQVSRLDNRIDRVGAGAAALAALHPLDYDPEVKWDFAAGYGNYRGANAVSVGAFYRPNEDVMFSVGGSMGGGENMVNAGVSFKLGSGSGLTTSRTAMARELAAMKDTVAAQNAQIEAQAKQIEELTALVAQLAAEKAGAPEEKKA